MKKIKSEVETSSLTFLWEKKMKKKFCFGKNFTNCFVIFCVAILALGFFSCATTKVPEVPVLSKYDDMMFWKIEGADANGKLSTIYVLGTIHVGDERLYPLPQEIAQAYGKADKVYGEISSQGWKNLVTKLSFRMQDSQKEATKIEAERGIAWYDTLTDEQQKFLEEKLGKNIVDSQKIYMPWVLYSAVSNLTLQGTDLSSNYAYDTHFITVSNNYGIEMFGLDDLEVQLDIMSYGDIDIQMDMMTSTIDEMLKDENAAIEETKKLYETYLSGDENALAACLFDDMEKEIAEEPYMVEYYDLLFTERNTNWAETFAELLNEGGTTFVFAGSGHFVGNNSVFSIMKENGDLVF